MLLLLAPSAARAETVGGPFLAPPPDPEPAPVRAPVYRIESVAALGDRLVERVAVSVDIITAASPNHKLYGLPVGAPVDVISSPSRINEAEQIDTDSTYAWSRTTNLGLHAVYHLEEPLESWGLGALYSHSFADDNTVVSGSFYQLVDWFDNFTIDGKRFGRNVRATTNANVGLTQLMTPMTVLLLDYGFTVQGGTLSNTWNSVPLADGDTDDDRATFEPPRQPFEIGQLDLASLAPGGP